MSVPAWILWAFAAIMLVVAGVSAGRIAAGLARWRRGGSAAGRDVDGAHVLMGVAMAGMLVTGLRTLPAGAWEVVFAALAGWFGWRVLSEARSGLAWWRGGHYLPHLVHSLAMLYAFLALTPAGSGPASSMARMGAGAAAMGTLRLPTLAFGFAAVLAVFAIWDLDRVSGALERGARRAAPGWAAAGQGGACEATFGRVAMGVTMAFMLVIML
ncbi:MAG TPA: DUF5134 domain-containing protein [Streptosporangiaceae bacterium]|nr:DUF5134 domain-containing protein [Streptosporangiaceae bacterium]